MAMRIFTVHIKPYSPAPDGEAVLIKEGFCWPAALIPILWALYRRLWRWVIILIAAQVAISMVGDALGFGLSMQLPVAVAFAAYVGFSANDWRRAGLARRGFALADIVVGKDMLAAERRYFQRALMSRRTETTSQQPEATVP
jgi:hypothetical protein